MAARSVRVATKTWDADGRLPKRVHRFGHAFAVTFTIATTMLNAPGAILLLLAPASAALALPLLQGGFIKCKAHSISGLTFLHRKTRTGKLPANYYRSGKYDGGRYSCWPCRLHPT